MTALRHYKFRAPLLSYSAALLVPLALSACKKPQDRPQRQSAMVSVAEAKRATVPYMIEANGVVTPLQTAAVTSQVDGIVTSVDFQEGGEVRTGQPLFHIDARPYQNAYDQALAVFARDSASWSNARKNAERYKSLMSQRVITAEEGEQQVTSAATSEATLAADRAAVAQAKFNLDNTIIRAPISGKTGSLLVRQGNLVHSGSATPLVVINQVRPILVRFAIPASQLPMVLQYGSHGGLAVAAVPGGVAPPSPSIDSLAAAAMNPIGDAGAADAGSGRRGGRGGNRGGGAPSAVPGGSTNGSVGSASGSLAGGAAAAPATPVQQGGPIGERLMGKLSFIDNAVDTATGTVQLKALFDNSNGRLWSGQFATTSLHLFDEENALVVPEAAITTGQRGTYVYVVDQSDTARQRPVIVERTANGLAIISSGIHEGDRVVVDGQSRLTPDAPVRLRGANDNGGAPAGGGRRGGGRRGGKGGASAGGNGGGGSGSGQDGSRGG